MTEPNGMVDTADVIDLCDPDPTGAEVPPGDLSYVEPADLVAVGHGMMGQVEPDLKPGEQL